MPFLPSSSSIWMANFSSRTLRPIVCWVASATLSASSPASSTKTFFTYCWVSVEAPWETPPLCAFSLTARRMPLRSIAPCS